MKMEDINTDLREMDARKIFRALQSESRPDISVSIIAKAIDEWYMRGVMHGKCGIAYENMEEEW